MGGKAGGIFGVIVALVLVAALAATPFYLGLLQSPERALDARVEADAERVRRAVATLDHELAALSAMYASVPNGDFDRDAAYRFAAEHPGIFPKSFMTGINKLVDYLEDFEARDRQRGTTVIGKGTINRIGGTGVKAENVVRDVQPLLKGHEEILRKADAAINTLRSATAGDLSAANHLDANRVRAVYYLIKARIEADKAAFEHDQAALLLAAAQDRATALGDMKSTLSSLDATDPAPRIADAEQVIASTKSELDRLRQMQQQLAGAIQARESELERLRNEADFARGEMERLTQQNLPFDQFMRRYGELSDTVRVAEARVAALQFGTLRDAAEIPQETVDPVPPQYEGGTPEPGLEMLKFRARQLDEHIASVSGMLELHEKQLSSLRELEEKMAQERSGISEALQTHAAELKRVTDEAAERLGKATKCEDAALKFLKDASAAARSGIGAAKKRAGDAAAAARSGEKVDERLQRVSQDVEAEAYLHTLAGQALFEAAQLRFLRIQAEQNQVAAAAYIARLIGGESPAATDDIETLRTDALNDLSEAQKALDQVATLVGRINVRFADNTSASGKNYVWQAQIGKAACHMLHSALVADDADASFAQQEMAYNTLKEAVENREQSPLLAPAFDALVYLQKNVR